MNFSCVIRPVALLLVLLVLFSAIACTKDQDQESDTTTPGIDNGTTTAPETDEPAPDLPEVKFSGKKITFLEREIEPGNNIDVYFYEIYGENSGETMSNATYERTLLVSEKYDIEIESVRMLNNSIYQSFINTYNAGEHLYDVLHANGGNTLSLAINGYLLDMNTVPYVNYDAPWWMGMVMDATSISNVNAFAIGYTNVHSFMAVTAVYFNKGLVEDLTLESPYQLVKDGKWTIDTMYKYCATAVSDLNGDGVMNADDRYGIIFNPYVWAPFFYGSSLRVIEKDTDDIPYINFNDETVFNTLAKVIDFLADYEVHACTSWMQLGEQETAFLNGHSMFYVQLMYTVMKLRAGDLDFGILPIPKLEESQEKYYSSIHNKSSFTSIPKDNQDLEMTGIILEDMAYYSYKIVRPAFFDILLDGKVARDEESWDMLDIVFENMYLCLMRSMTDIGLTTDNTVRNFIINKTGSGAMKSTFKMSMTVWEKKLEGIADSFMKSMGQ
ncbi:MAG: hypothetical protein GX057_01025 [Clostridiales bacterium]|nr:hypothetical protein [Clostridiales bacterium]HOA84406.1 hypothetical protein [Bacillota bacterium]